MICPKHKVPMTVLFTSAVCDLCDPPKTAGALRKGDLGGPMVAQTRSQPTTNGGILSNVPMTWKGQGATGYQVIGRTVKFNVFGDWEVREMDPGHSNDPTILSILDWNGQPASYVFALKKYDPSLVKQYNICGGNFYLEVIDQGGNVFHTDDMTLRSWDRVLVAAQVNCVFGAVAPHITSCSPTVQQDLKNAVDQIFTWKKW